jgi:hypothetical protein
VYNEGAPRQKGTLEWSRMRWQRMSASSVREYHSEPRKILIKMLEQSVNSSECKTPFSLNLFTPPSVRDDDTYCVCVRSSDWAGLAAMQHNRDHLIANVLSAQKDEDGHLTWLDFSPPFHTHLVQCARVLVPPHCPMGKWKKVMFVFILEVLCGKEGPRPESFWEVPKKRRHCCPICQKSPRFPL